MDIVIQGGLYPETIKTAELYSKFLGVDNVIVSCWEGDNINDADNEIIDRTDNIILLRNEKPDIVGSGNRNLQIISSKNGINKATSDIVLKIRSDQRLYHSAFVAWREYVEKHIQEKTGLPTEGKLPKGKIFVIGMQHLYPYHPQDHIFWGYKEDVSLFFDLPLSPTNTDSSVSNAQIVTAPGPLDPSGNTALLVANQHGEIEFTAEGGNLRTPIYLGMFYFANFYKEAKKHCENPEEYLYDSAPKYNEAMKYYEKTRDSLFKILPRIDDCMWWEKFNSGYWYDRYYSMGERYV